MNNCVFSGFISSIEKKTGYGKTICVLSLGVKNAKGYNDILPLVAYEGLAEALLKYCSKGSKICVQTHAILNKYTDKAGINHSAVKFIVDSQEFISNCNYDTRQPLPVESVTTSINGEQPITLDEVSEEDMPF